MITDGPQPARILLVGEAPGAQEEYEKRPFVGQCGQELTRMLGEAGIARSECRVTNACHIRPPHNDIGAFIAMSKKDVTPAHVPYRGRMVLPQILDGAELLAREIEVTRPNIILAFGNVPMWMLTGNWGIVRWRGSMLHENLTDGSRQVVPTFHPAAVLRQWEWRRIALCDMRRAARFIGGEAFPVPDWNFRIRPTFDRAQTLLTQLYLRAFHKDALTIAVDIETARGHITCIGLAWSLTDALCIPFIQGDWEPYWSLEEEAALVYKLYLLLRHPRVKVVMQNGLYDFQYLLRHWHWTPTLDQDSMISHHVAFPGLKKSLDFQASLYCNQYAQWKPERGNWKEGG